MNTSPATATGDQFGEAALIQQPIVLRLVWSAALVGLSALVHLPALLTSRPIDDDETYLAVMGRMIAHGDNLYQGVIDRKPPLAIWAYRWLVPNSWSLRWVHIAAILLIALNGWIVAQIALRLGANGTTALTAGALTVIGSSLLGHADAHSANFEVWGLVPATVAVWCIVRSPRSFVYAALAGAAVSVATNCKQPYVFTLVAVVIAARRGARLRVAAVAASACATVTVGIAAFAGWSGYWRWVWLENGDYVKVGVATIVVLAIRQTLIFVALQWPLAVGVVMGLRKYRGDNGHRAPRDPATHAVVALAGWAIAALLGVASGLRFFGHYYQQLIPPLALLAAFGMASWARTRQVLAAATAWALALFGLVIFPSLRGLEAAPVELARVVRAATSPDDRVLIWGRLPDGAVRSHRVTAGRFVHHAYLTGLWANAERTTPAIMAEEPYASRWTDFLADLKADPPKLIIDATPIVDGWDQFLLTATPLRAWLSSCYTAVDQSAGLATYRLRSEQGCLPPIN